MEMGRLRYREREPNEPPREEPKLLKQMIAFHRNKLGYSTLERRKLLHLSKKNTKRRMVRRFLAHRRRGLSCAW